MSSFLSVLDFLAQTAPAAPAPGAQPQPSGWVTFLPMILLFAAMYFLMIAPQRKKQKAHEAMLKAIGPGDEVVTSGGIFGVISAVKEDRFIIRVAEGTKLELGKAFVTQVIKKSGEEKK